jgi:hypothetical protein
MSLEWLKAGATRLRRQNARNGDGFDATAYWDRRYAAGGTSGDGSYGRLAAFKARVLSTFVAQNAITSCIEFGCGDGNQLGLIPWPRYIGLDVSVAAVTRCINRYSNDRTKSFFLYHPGCFLDRYSLLQSQVAVSLDVVYHVTDDRQYDSYMKDVCNATSRFVVIYSTDYDRIDSCYIRHRRVTTWMASQAPAFRLTGRLPNPFPGTRLQESDAEFLFYERSVHTDSRRPAVDSPNVPDRLPPFT